MKKNCFNFLCSPDLQAIRQHFQSKTHTVMEARGCAMVIKRNSSLGSTTVDIEYQAELIIPMSATVEIKMEPPSTHKDETSKALVEPKAPYFHYRDHSHLVDPDPSKPVTIPGRIPTFPAKLFAILSRPDLSDIISWMPHGRSWKVHKPREFEVKVIPSYFDHAKFSSFIRQANGWGFKRVTTKGTDRNSHYHELFLRGIPHLIKFMKRPVSGSNAVALAQFPKGKDCDPDFYKISDVHPLPEFTPKMMHPLDESSFLNSSKNSQVVFGSAFNCLSDVNVIPCVKSSSSDGMGESMTQLQSFYSENESSHHCTSEHMPSPTPQSQAFLLPRGIHHRSISSTSQPSMTVAAPLEAPSSCPFRQEEKDLDPLTILLNDLSDENTWIEDTVIQSLINDPSVPPPSSLKVATHVFAPAMVSPVEEKLVLDLASEALDFATLEYFHDDSMFESHFTQDFSSQHFF